MAPFTPKSAGTVNIDVAGTTANVAVTTQPGVTQVRVMNNGTATAWITFGDSAVTATTTTGVPVGPGVTEVFTVSKNVTAIYAAAIAAGATGRIYFTPGSGV